MKSISIIQIIQIPIEEKAENKSEEFPSNNNDVFIILLVIWLTLKIFMFV